MGIFDRLGDVIKSYLQDDDEEIFGRTSRAQRRSADPDLDAAFEELDDYLRGGPERQKGSSGGKDRNTAQAGGENLRGGKTGWEAAAPEALRKDFAELGLPFGASADECKRAYKGLLKQHHPDRHAGHPGNMKRATEKSARINAAFDRIERWRETGKAE
jgi:DnaJ-domain-containing protein 1